MNEMNEKMIIKVLPAEGRNPDFAPEKELQDGIECHGYILMTFNKEHELEVALMTNLSIKNISDAVIGECDADVISTMRQAFTIAEGFVKAARIKEDHMKAKIVDRMKKVMSGIDPDEVYPDEFPEDEIQEFPEEE